MPTYSDLPAYAGLGLLGAVIGIMMFREMSRRLEIPKPVGITEDMLVGIMRREYGAMATESYSHLMAPAINSMLRTIEMQHELMKELRNDQGEILKILAVVADRIPR